MHDVFISYGSKDAESVERICRVLEGNGIKCWIAPRDIPAGSNYAREIPAAIRGCKIFLLILSEEAQTSIWVTREVDQALNARKIVIPVMLEDFPLNDEFNFYLTGCQRYNAYEKSSAALENLVHRLWLLLGVLPDGMAQLRYDGYYVTEPSDNRQRMYYRFFPSGKVISCSSSGDPVAVSKWLNESYQTQAEFSLRGTDVEFNVPIVNGNFIKYRGSVREDALKLIGYSTFAKKHTEYHCTFVSLAEIAEEEQTPKAEIIDIRTIDPKRPARLGETMLRFDGVYCTAPKHGNRTYYRFYPDGALVSAFTSATPAQVCKWLNMEKYEGGRACFDGQTLRIEKPLSDGKRYYADVLLVSDRMLLKGFNTYTQKDQNEECTFLPFSSI